METWSSATTRVSSVPYTLLSSVARAATSVDLEARGVVVVTGELLSVGRRGLVAPGVCPAGGHGKPPLFLRPG
ncbi:hypothetical protein ScoT_23390 [Streptomyces albidoflavus]|uniref:Uncharacterized protein n=1 Tax=Streptomyces albidoflavus TaxID=1886 RepID=A0AA37BWP2_9ACTN|nr:hypothetical protein ScoT_23390 [Streptomyces albidoflavus]